MGIIQLNNICKRYGKKEVLKDFSLNIEEGELIALTGTSGKGKSTILNIIGLLENPDSGDLIICNEKNIKPNTEKANEILRNTIGYLFQNFALVDEETVEYNLNIALKYVKVKKEEKKKLLEEALKKVGLQGFEKNKIYELSGGEQQRIAVARLMLKPSKIILADEPTGSLDEENREIIINLLKDINKSGKTIIIVTHDKYLANKCNRIIEI